MATKTTTLLELCASQHEALSLQMKAKIPFSPEAYISWATYVKEIIMIVIDHSSADAPHLEIIRVIRQRMSEDLVRLLPDDLVITEPLTGEIRDVTFLEMSRINGLLEALSVFFPHKLTVTQHAIN